MTYRDDIDGLRAIAVIAVILSHVHMLPGGYIGVDVFFVISGFLIAPSILQKISSKSFSVVDFYTRRAKRLLPQVYMLIAVSFLAAYFIFMPNEFILFSKSARETVIFISNFYFLSQAGYFSPDSITQPLLHTWSLAVEEQFYFVAPVMIYVLLKAKRPLLWGALIGIASLAFSVITLPYWPSANFFMLPFRVWEFVLGAAIAFLPKASKSSGNVCSMLGLGLILFSMFTLTEQSHFPGLNALPATVGTALIIWSGRETIIASALAWSPFRITGRASYSLYIWHWPIIVFYSYYSFSGFNIVNQMAMIAATFAVGFFFWIALEEPLRRSSFSAKKTGAAVVSSSLSVFALALFIKHEQGLPERLNDAARLMSESADDKHEFYHECVLPVRPDSFEHDVQNLCRVGIATGKPSFAIWGDSHAGSISFAISEEAKKFGLTGIILSVGGCAPIINAPGSMESVRVECIDNNTQAIKIFKSLCINTVFLHARWSVFNSEKYVQDLSKLFNVSIDDKPQDIVNVAMGSTKNALIDAGIEPVFVAAIPTADDNEVQRMARRLQTGLPIETSRPRSELDTINHRANISFSKHPEVQVLDPAPYFCNEEQCDIARNGQSLTRDGSHLTKTAARLLTGLFTTKLAEIKRQE